MKKKLLILVMGLVIVFAFTGCGKDTEAYKEEIYTPMQENIKKLDGQLEIYLSVTEDLRQNKEATLKEFFAEIEKITKDMEDIKPLDSFKEDEKKEFEDMKEEFNKATESIHETGVDIIGLYVLGESDGRVEEYENKSKTSNKHLDNFLKKFNDLSKEYGIKEEASIKNRTIEFKLKDIATKPLTSNQELLMESFLQGMNENKDQGITAEFDNDNRTFYVIFRDGINITNPQIIRNSAMSTSNTIESKIAGRVIVKVVYDGSRDEPLLTVLGGLILEDNIK